MKVMNGFTGFVCHMEMNLVTENPTKILMENANKMELNLRKMGENFAI